MTLTLKWLAEARLREVRANLAFAKRVAAEIGDTEPHPQAPQVPSDRRTVLFDADGQPLARRIGYRP